MCAIYGLDPRFTDDELLDAADEELLEQLRVWAAADDDHVRRPTGRHRRNLNALIVPTPDGAILEEGWWGFLENGEPVRFPSINTRSERLREQTGGLRRRAIVPLTSWYELQKPGRQWHEFALPTTALFGMAAITRDGRTADGRLFTCYSVVMRDATTALSPVHPRMPLLIPRAFRDEWLHEPASRELIDAALTASEELSRRIVAAPLRRAEEQAERLF